MMAVALHDLSRQSKEKFKDADSVRTIRLPINNAYSDAAQEG
jgi:hypothetical protein